MGITDDLKDAIRASELSQVEIAKRAKVGQVFVSRFLNDERGVSLKVAERLAHAIDGSLVMGGGKRKREGKRK